MRLGKILVVLVFAVAVCFVVLRFLPAASNVAFNAPTYNQKLGVQWNGWAITWTMLIFAVASFGGYKLVQR